MLKAEWILVGSAAPTFQELTRRTWFGHMATLRAATDAVGCIESRAIVRERALQSGRSRLVILHGVITEISWWWLAQEIDEAPPETRLLVMSVNSFVQEAAGWDLVMGALARAGERMVTAADIHSAGGLAVWTAQACDWVSARPAAPIGWLAWESSLVTEADGSEWQSRGYTPLELGRERGFSADVARRLRDRAMTAEALEGCGVDFLAPNVAIATGRLQRIIGSAINA